MELASLPARVFAWMIDSMLLGLVTGIVFRIVGTPYIGSAAALLLIEWTMYHGYFWTHHDGQTPGKMLVGIRVVKDDGTPMLWSDSVVRCLGYAINNLLMGIGWLVVFFDKERQGLHDRLAHTHVIKDK
jgi:uncharacterized RDD family membrane protein YckC